MPETPVPQGFPRNYALPREALLVPWPESNGCIKLLKIFHVCSIEFVGTHARITPISDPILATVRFLIGTLQQRILNNTAAHSSA